VALASVDTTEGQREAMRARRDERYRRRDFLAHFSTIRRVRSCGRNPIERESPVEVCKGETGQAYYRNVQRCGAGWACPVCAPKIAAGRAQEIETGLEGHRANGGGAYLMTLTASHRQGENLKRLLDLLSESFTGMLRGRTYQEQREAFGIVGTIRSWDFTHGLANGWHPHFHVVVLTATVLPDGGELLSGDLCDSWRRQLARRGGVATERNGFDWQAINSDADTASYLSKVYDERSFALEVARGDLKRAMVGRRTAWGILADAHTFGDVDDLALWREYERATKGKRRVQFSQGLRAYFGLDGDEPSDESLAAEEVLDEWKGPIVATLNHTTWRAVRHRRGALLAIVRAAERWGEQGVYELVDDWLVPPPPSVAAAALNLHR
jgi:hypothetical protein